MPKANGPATAVTNWHCYGNSQFSIKFTMGLNYPALKHLLMLQHPAVLLISALEFHWNRITQVYAKQWLVPGWALSLVSEFERQVWATEMSLLHLLGKEDGEEQGRSCSLGREERGHFVSLTWRKTGFVPPYMCWHCERCQGAAAEAGEPGMAQPSVFITSCCCRGERQAQESWNKPVPPCIPTWSTLACVLCSGRHGKPPRQPKGIRVLFDKKPGLLLNPTAQIL